MGCAWKATKKGICEMKQLTEMVISRLREEFPNGASAEEAADVCEIDDSSLRELMRRGRKTRRGLEWQLFRTLMRPVYEEEDEEE